MNDWIVLNINLIKSNFLSYQKSFITVIISNCGSLKIYFPLLLFRISLQLFSSNSRKDFIKMVQWALNVLADRPDRVKPFLTDIYNPLIGVIGGFSFSCFLNAISRRPIFSGLFSFDKQSKLCKQFNVISRNPKAYNL